MNLVTGEWIPVIDHCGGCTRVGLRQLFAAAEDIRDLAVNPPQRIALMRFLICLVQAALDGPEDQADWQTCKRSIRPKVEQYLQSRLACFELYGDRPFMQISTLKPTYNAVLDKLDFGLAAGNNAVLFDHAACQQGRPHDDGWKALMLLVYLEYSPGGLIGTTEWNGRPTGKTSEHAPCVESSAIHTLIRADNILDSMHYNLNTRQRIAGLPNLSWGRPTWELDLANNQDAMLLASVTTYLGRLVPLTRAILLTRGSSVCTLANGLAYPKFPECREPTATVVGRKNGDYGYLPTSLDRHPWRELGALLTLSVDQQGGACALGNLKSIGRDEVVDIWTGGLAADKGKILDVAEWGFSVPVGMIANEGPIGIYRQGVEAAEAAEKRLYAAVKTYATDMSIDSAPMPKARTIFWSILDQHYGVLFETANDPGLPPEAQWLPLVQDAAHAAFEQVCPRTTPRQIQAFAKARPKLNPRRK